MLHADGPRASTTRDRRALLRTALAVGVIGLLAGTLTADEERSNSIGRTDLLRIATGEPDGFYAAFGRLLATECTKGAVPLSCRCVFTEASVANVELLRTGQAELAITLAHTAAAAMAGAVPFRGRQSLRALGRVYENYLQLAVCADSDIQTLPELAGRTLSLGAPESGGAALGEQLLRAAGLVPGDDLRVRRLLMPDAAHALRQGTIDALLVAGGVPLPLLTELEVQPGFRLLPLADFLPQLRASRATGSEWLDAVTVPESAYRGSAAVTTIGVANLLLCRPDLPDDVASTLTKLLVLRADHLVPAESVGAQFLDAPSLVTTGAVPLHPGAVAAYRKLHG